MSQTIFTVVSPVRPGEQGKLNDLLVDLGYIGPLPEQDPFGFGKVRTLHFASVFLYDDAEDGWSLVFESNIDGEIEAYIDSLFAVATDQDGGKFLIDLYARCQGFVGKTLPDLKRYMLDRVHRPQAGYVSAVNMTRDRILQDAAVYRVVDEVLGSGAEVMAPAEAQAKVFEALDADPETKDTWKVADEGTSPGLIRGIGAVAEAVVNAIGFAVTALINLIPERVARQDSLRPDLDLVDSQKQYEDFLPTNHMVSVVHLHSDFGRLTAKRCAYGLLRALVTLLYHKGKLGVIETIHFAHWVILNRGRRLLFVSNFGGSWDSYLDDFTLKSARGLTLAWAHGIGFPKSRFMLLGGAAKGPEFIDWARRSMVPTQVWYKAYPGVSARNINRNRKLRDGLTKAKANPSKTEWLELV